MKKLILSFVMIAASHVMGQQTPFLDPMFSVVDVEGGQLKATSPNNNVVYGKGNINGAADGEMNLLLDLYYPTGPGLPAQLPGVVFIHGGGFTSGIKEDYAMQILAIEYAKRGYIAASIGYRLSGVNGVDPDEGNPAAAINDATKAIQWMISEAVPGGATERLMVDKIVIGGGSAGAITSLMQGCSNISEAQPKVILNFWGALLGNDFKFIDPTGPATPVDASDPPVFIVHGTKDTDVQFYNATNLCTRLDLPSVNVPYKLFTLANQPHAPWNTVFNIPVDGKTILQHSVDFCYGHLELGVVPPVADHAPVDNPVRIRYDNNQLVLLWKGQPGKVYDLLTNVELISPPSTWLAYSEVITGGEILTYSGIPAGGHGTVVMTPYNPPPGAMRFFVMRETSD